MLIFRDDAERRLYALERDIEYRFLRYFDTLYTKGKDSMCKNIATISLQPLLN